MPKQLVSRNRTELMGIATLSVFLAHILHRYHSNPFGDVIPALFLYTYGFFFLSGYGIYFSLRKSTQTAQFYKKRLNRVIFPYLCISFIPITIITLLNNDEFIDYILRILTLGYWIEGNVCGTWYISVVLILYLFAPLLSLNTRYVTITVLVPLVASYGYSILHSNTYAYAALQASFFYIGFLYANGFNTKKFVFSFLSIFLLSFLLTHKYWFIEAVLALISIFVWTCLIPLCSKPRALNNALNWLGNNSLFLYLLHLQSCIVLEKSGVKGKTAILIAIVTALTACGLKDKLKSWLKQENHI